jgi:putative endonuclease
MKYYIVYILKCADGSYYTGITNNLERRMNEHLSGASKESYTSSRLPVECVFNASFTDPNSAIKMEKRIKGWSRKKKEALITDNYDELVRLSNLKNNANNFYQNE